MPLFNVTSSEVTRKEKKSENGKDLSGTTFRDTHFCEKDFDIYSVVGRYTIAGTNGQF